MAGNTVDILIQLSAQQAEAMLKTLQGSIKGVGTQAVATRGELSSFEAALGRLKSQVLGLVTAYVSLNAAKSILIGLFRSGLSAVEAYEDRVRQLGEIVNTVSIDKSAEALTQNMEYSRAAVERIGQAALKAGVDIDSMFRVVKMMGEGGFLPKSDSDITALATISRAVNDLNTRGYGNSRALLREITALEMGRATPLAALGQLIQRQVGDLKGWVAQHKEAGDLLEAIAGKLSGVTASTGQLHQQVSFWVTQLRMGATTIERHAASGAYETITKAVQKITEWIAKNSDEVSARLKPAFDALGRTVTDLVNWLIENWENVVNLLTGAVQVISGIAWGFQRAGELANWLLTIVTQVSTVIANIVTFFERILHGDFKGAFTGSYASVEGGGPGPGAPAPRTPPPFTQPTKTAPPAEFGQDGGQKNAFLDRLAAIDQELKLGKMRADLIDAILPREKAVLAAERDKLAALQATTTLQLTGAERRDLANKIAEQGLTVALQELAVRKEITAEVNKRQEAELRANETAARVSAYIDAEQRRGDAASKSLRVPGMDRREYQIGVVQDEIQQLQSAIATTTDKTMYKLMADLKAKNVELANLINKPVLDAVDATTKTIEGSFTQSWDSILTGAQSFGDAIQGIFTNVGKAIISQFGQILAQRVVAGMGMDAMLKGLFTFGEGGVVGGSLIPIAAAASGGVFSRPTLAMVAEAGGDEAVIPLRSGRVPVELSGGKGGGGDTVHIFAWDTVTGMDQLYKHRDYLADLNSEARANNHPAERNQT